jgi:hypothetical protein
LSDFVFLVGNKLNVVLLGLFFVSGEFSLGFGEGDLDVVEHVLEFSEEVLVGEFGRGGNLD